MQLFYCQNIENDTFSLNEEESRHAVKVLRKMNGDTLYVVDGKGTLFTCEIIDNHPKHTTLRVEEKSVNHEPLPYSLHIAIAPTKNIDRTEWFMEKATEIGIDAFTPLKTEHSERKVVNLERLDKVLVSAMKQSLKAYKPELSVLTSFNDFISQDFEGYDKFIAHCNEGEERAHLKTLIKSDKVVIMIGPEGDFSPVEVAKARERGFKEISLGVCRLRTETAAVYATTTVALSKI